MIRTIDPTAHDVGMTQTTLEAPQRIGGRRHAPRAAAGLGDRGHGRAVAPVLLVDATWYGTLAAARDLGARGVPVVIGFDKATAPVLWSRYVRKAVRCPETTDVDRFVEWLHDFGERNPGTVLYPTSDDVAFLLAYHRETLEPLYRLFLPPMDSLIGVLDKSALRDASQRAGLATPVTWTPSGIDEVRELASTLPYPVLIKPRSQVVVSGSTKGIRIDDPEDLAVAWSRVQQRMRFNARATVIAPDLGLPIIQELHAVSEEIYTVDGFADRDGRIVGALACVKRLQLPRGSGSGVCFEAAELDPETLTGLERLCRQTGFAGVFDVEFALDSGRRLLIDFNPRFYNHMAFEIERGLPLPWLAYLAATGQDQALWAHAELAAKLTPERSGIYVHRLSMQLMLAAQRLSGAMTWRERREWRRWMRRHRAAGIHDPAFGRRDPMPGILDAAHLLRYPRSLGRKAASGR